MSSITRRRGRGRIWCSTALNRRWYFSTRRISRSACWRWLARTPASNGSSWMAARSIASTLPGQPSWKRYRRTCARAGFGSALPTSNRGSRLAGPLWSTGGTRRWCTISDSQISRGCLRLRRVCRNIGNRNRTIVGNRTRWIRVSATRLTAPPFGTAAPIGHAERYCQRSFFLDEFFCFHTGLVTGEQRDYRTRPRGAGRSVELKPAAFDGKKRSIPGA